MKTRFEDYCERQKARYGDAFVAPTCAPLIEAYNKGTNYRVQICTKYPSGARRVRWGYVTLTTGWEPSFMLMSRRGQSGSSDLIGDTDTIIGSHWL